MKIAIIGAGSVGTNLHHAFELKGIKAELVHARPLTANRSPIFCPKQTHPCHPRGRDFSSKCG